MQLFHQFLERNILVRVSSETDLSHLAQKFREPWMAGYPGPQGKGVHKESNQELGLRLAPPGYGRSYSDLDLACVAVQQNLESSHQGHENCGTLPVCQSSQGFQKWC